jgi:hypothetical protein
MFDMYQDWTILWDSNGGRIDIAHEGVAGYSPFGCICKYRKPSNNKTPALNRG